MSEIESVWREHQAAAFPSDCRGEDIDGVDLVLLDTETAGCISTYLTKRGQINSNQIACLRHCCDELDVVVPELGADARAYFHRLQRLARLTYNTANDAGSIDNIRGIR